MPKKRFSKKARVARNVLHIGGEDELKFEVNEEAWPNADLARVPCLTNFLLTKSRLETSEKSRS